ncbi:MAG TPA: DUF192 domain-containing protein [Burkholderiaceae bacterium]|nr:DUF192 domain-containing protein [Burkholderiaceae bacterium]
MLRLLVSLRYLLLAVGAMLSVAAVAQTGPQPTLPTTRLTAGMHIITAEVAAAPLSRTVGMMFRETVAPNHGMLFVFEDKGQQCFWMRNTLLPLSIAFIEDDGTILQIADMAPKSEALHCSQGPVRYALEMEQGWYAKKGMVVGSKIRGLPAPR